MKRRLLTRRGRTSTNNTSDNKTAGGSPSVLQLASELMVVFAVVTIGITIFLWWHYVASNPKRVFVGVLNNALQTSSTTVRIDQTASGQGLNQAVQLNLSGKHVAHAITALSQPDSTAITETIGTPSNDFVRYSDIKTTQHSANGKALDFRQVLGVWADSQGNASQTNGQLYNQVVLGVIPVGNLSLSQRQTLLNLLMPAYQVNYTNVDRSLSHGRPTYTYTVIVQPVSYVVMLKQYARFTGLTQLEQLNPADYRTSPTLAFKLTVDVWSRQMESIAYENSNRVIRFSQNDQVLTPVALPSHTIPITELESRLQSLQ